jgi:hypothetical protein
MKLFVRFLVIFSLLFLGRYEYLYAFTASKGTVISINPAHPDKENHERIKAVELTEEDDEDKIGTFKNLTSGDNISSFHYAPSPEYFTVKIKTAQPLGKCALYIAPHKYILFGVFRV